MMTGPARCEASSASALTCATTAGILSARAALSMRASRARDVDGARFALATRFGLAVLTCAFALPLALTVWPAFTSSSRLHHDQPVAPLLPLIAQLGPLTEVYRV